MSTADGKMRRGESFGIGLREKGVSVIKEI